MTEQELVDVVAWAVKAAQAPLLARIVALEADLQEKSVYLDQRIGEVKGLVGPAGPMGPMGPQGPTGETGPPGVVGTNGADGARGEAGPVGERGSDGLLGPQGPIGRDGRDGAPGLNGKDGADGLHGRDGKDGAPGLHGKDGKDGLHGQDGSNGSDGLDGKDGKDGAPGLHGKDGTNGRDGLGFDEARFEKDARGRVLLTLRKGDVVVTSPPLGHALQGPWSELEAYEAGDVVIQEGGLWIAKQAHTGLRPGTDAGGPVWQLSVKRGQQGKAGAEGPQGPAGRDLTQLDPTTGRKW